MDSIFKLAVILSAVDHLTGPLRQAARQLETLDRVASRAQGMQELGKKLAVAGATSAVAGSQMMGYLKGLIAPALEGEEALARVAIMTRESIEVIDKAATQWSLLHMDSDTAFIGAAQRMMQAGLGIESAIEGTRVAMAVARVTQSDHIATSKLLAAAYNTMGDKTRNVAQEMTRLGDILTATKNAFQIDDLDQFASAFSLAGRSAIPARVPLAQLAAVLGTLNRAGLQGRPMAASFNEAVQKMEAASRRLRFTLARTSDGGLDLVTTLGNIQKKFGAVSEMSPRMTERFQEAFGPGGLLMLSFLEESIAAGSLAKSFASIENPAMRLAEALALVEGTGSGQVQIIANNWERVREILGGFVLPMLVAMRPHIQGWTTWAAGFIEAHPALFKIAIGLFAIVTALATVTGAVLTAAGGLTLLIGNGAGAFAKLGTFAFQASSKIVHFGGKLLLLGKTQIPALVSGIGTFIARARTMAVLVGTQMGRELQVAATAMRAAAAATWSWTAALLANPIGMVVAAVAVLAGGIYLIYRNWQTLADFYEVVWAKVTAVFQGFIDWVAGWIVRVVGLVQGLWAQIQSHFGGGLSGVLKLLVAFSPAGILMLALGEVAKLLQGTTWFNEGAALIQGLIDGIKSMAAAAWSSVANIATGVRDRFKAMLGISSPSTVFLDFGTNVVAGLARGMQLAEGLASNRVAQLARAVTAAAAIAAAPTIAMATSSAPSILPAMDRSSLGTQGGATVVHITYNPQITMAGNADAATEARFEELLRAHERRILQIVRDGLKKAERPKF